MARMLKLILMIPPVIVALILIGGPAGTWLYLHFSPARSSATVLEKNESIYRGYSGRETQNFYLKVRYQPSDTPLPETPTISVDEQTYDQSRAGTKLEIAYIPQALLRQIPLYYTKRLAQPLPAKDVPDAQRSADAVVKHIRLITTTADSSRRRGLPAWQPFQVIEMSFTPEGRNEPVTAIDHSDLGSLPNLKIGRPIPITYSLRTPRAAKIVGAGRENEWKNALETYALFTVLGSVLLFIVVMARRRS